MPEVPAKSPYPNAGSVVMATCRTEVSRGNRSINANATVDRVAATVTMASLPPTSTELPAPIAPDLARGD